MNIGYIYKITNNINGKVYIGQTSKTIEERWREHKRNAKDKNRKAYNIHFYKAIRKYGIENFSIEEVEKCNISGLDEREIYWIAYYDSFHNGYNSTLGGDGGRILDLDEKEVIKKYQELNCLSKTGKYFDCSPNSIAYILKKQNIPILDFKNAEKENVNKIYLYDKDDNLLKTFNGRSEVGQWLINKKLTENTNPYNAGDIIRQRFRRTNNFELFGYIWKIERSFDIEYYKERDKEYNKIQYYKSKTNHCQLCGKTILSESILCNNCENNKRKQEAIQNRKTEYGITRETLKYEIRTTSFVQLGKKYSVSDKTISKWCKIYNLPYKSSEIKKYSDEEWEKL